MMKFRKAVIFLLCGIMAFSLTGCSKHKPGGDDSGTIYTVAFDVGPEASAAEVQNPASLEINGGGTMGENMPVPAWGSNTFGGWFDGETQYTASTEIHSNLTLLAKWYSEEEMDEIAQAYEANISSWDQANHLYIHYKRYDHAVADQGKTNTGAPQYSSAIDSATYSDWGCWAWPKNDNGRLFNAAKIDESGAVYDIDLTQTYTDAGWDGTLKQSMNQTMSYADAKVVGFQLHSIYSRTHGSGFWANDGGDVDLTLADIRREKGSYHWFVNQGNVTTGSKTFTNKKLVDPYKDKPTGSMTTKRAVSAADKIIDSTLNNSSTYPTPATKPASYENDGVGYQIFIASFADSNGDGIGDLRGIIQKLDYLDSLNVDVLWLTPFQSSTNYHGYDIKDYFSVDPRFGTLADYRELVKKVHDKGMKIVMDFVLNHTSKSNPWFVKSQNLVTEQAADGSTIDYRNFYTWISKSEYNSLSADKKAQYFGPLNGNGSPDDGYYFYSSFSSDMPELNYDYQPVRDAILDVCNYWMAFGLDGFRLDAVKHIYMVNELYGKTPSAPADGSKVYQGKGCVSDGSYSYDIQRNLNFYREFNYRLKKNYPNAFLVGENLDGNPLNTTNYFQGIDSQFNFNLYYDVSRSLAAARQYSNAGDGTTAIKQYIGGYYGNTYDDVDKSQPGAETVPGYATVNPYFIDGLFTSNHDLPRARERMNVTTNSARNTDTYHSVSNANNAAITESEQMLRAYYAFIMTVPGINWIYYGDEIGMTGLMPTSDNASTTASADATPHEDRIYRQPMKWKTDVSQNAHFKIGYGDLELKLEGLNATDKVQSVEKQLEAGNPDSLLHYVQKLTAYRRANANILVNGKMEWNGRPISTSNPQPNCMSGTTLYYTIKNGSQKITVYINCGTQSFNKFASGTKTVLYPGVNGSASSLGKWGVAVVKG